MPFVLPSGEKQSSTLYKANGGYSWFLPFDGNPTQYDILSVVCVGAINVCGAVCKYAINICGAVWKRLIPVNRK